MRLAVIAKEKSDFGALLESISGVQTDWIFPDDLSDVSLSDYESLVITLGEGAGNNFWCVLFPPLCLLDTEEEPENVEYTSFVKEVIDKYF